MKMTPEMERLMASARENIKTAECKLDAVQRQAKAQEARPFGTVRRGDRFRRRGDSRTFGVMYHTNSGEWLLVAIDPGYGFYGMHGWVKGDGRDGAPYKIFGDEIHRYERVE